MTKNKKDNEKVVQSKSATKLIKIPDFTKSRVVRRQVSVLARLTNWQKKSANTSWVIGEYLDS